MSETFTACVTFIIATIHLKFNYKTPDENVTYKLCTYSGLSYVVFRGLSNLQT